MVSIKIFFVQETTPNELKDFISIHRCGECKSIAGIWEELAVKFNSKPDSEIVVAKVDCQAETDLCAYQDISDYPTYAKLYIA